MAGTSTNEAFASFYLQRATQEFAEAIDKARTADDFKPDSVPFLVHALQQGTALYSDADKDRVMNPPVMAAEEDGKRAGSESESQDEERTAKKESKKKRKRKSEGRS